MAATVLGTEVDHGGPGFFGPGGDNWDGGDGDGRDNWRSPSGLPWLGMGLGLVSITSFFVALVSVYLFRSHSLLFWQPVAVPRWLWLSTALILTSSGTLEAARHALDRLRFDRLRRRLLLTGILGLAFLVSQLLALEQLFQQGLYLRGDPHASMFYVFTGAHGAHLVGGILALAWLSGRRPGLDRFRVQASVVTLYWHFMDVVWLGLFLVLLAKH